MRPAWLVKTRLATPLSAAPLLFTLGVTLLLTAALLLWQFGQEIVIWIFTTQQQLHQLLQQHVSAVAQSPWQHGIWLIVAAFAYGIFHAVGPGHGKAIIISYLGTQQRAGLRLGVVLSMLGALFQALVAIGLVSVFALILNLSLSRLNDHEWVLESASYGLLALLGALICLRTLWSRWPKTQTVGTPAPRLQPATPGPLAAASFLPDSSPSAKEQHCDCHHHLTPAEQVDLKESLLLIAAMGLRPCSGALLVLVYAYLVQVYAFGIAAVIAMGLGTGSAVALLAMLVVYCREWLSRRAHSTSGLSKWSAQLGWSVRLLGGLLLLALGLALLSAVNMQPQSHPIL